MNKRRTIATIIGVLAIAVVVMVGCKNDEKEFAIQDEYSIESIDEFDPTDGLLFLNDISRYKSSNSLIKLIQIDLWRRSKNCDKLGICEVIILGDTVYQSKYYEGPSRQILVALECQNQKTNAILNILLSGPIPEGITSDDLRFYVDEDIYGYDEESGDYVVFPQGIYEFNPNLGEYGGYSVLYSTGRVNI